MQRFNRTQFFAFGVLGILNTVGILLYGLGITTHGNGGSEPPLPGVIAMAGLCLLGAFVAAIRRGRDLGWSGWLTTLGFWLSVSLGPLLVLLVGYFAAKAGEPGANAYGPAPRMNPLATWLFAPVALICPWLLLAMLGLAT